MAHFLIDQISLIIIANQNANYHVWRKNFKNKTANEWIYYLKLQSLNLQLEKLN